MKNSFEELFMYSELAWLHGNMTSIVFQEQDYSYDKNMEYWSLRPVTVIQRALQIGTIF